MQKRNANFSAGPAILPVEVVEKVKDNLLSYQGSGIGLMEMSHRSKAFMEIIETAEANLRELLDINDNYAILFVPGGASTQFSSVAMNLGQKDKAANYIITGTWADKAAKEASKFTEISIAASSKDKNFSYIPKEINVSKNASYLHFTSNNTIAGTQFHTEPTFNSDSKVPLICDASSDLLHKKIDINKYGLIYAGAQKNLGPAGVTLVIIKKDLQERIQDNLPIMLDYRTHIENNSLYNTPPCLPIYVVGEVFKWIKNLGGLDAVYKNNQEKAKILYDIIDSNKNFVGIASTEDRSLMNVTFKLAEESRQEEFLAKAKEVGLSELKGHRSVGGLRASIYNACPKEDVQKLADFMQSF